MLPDDLRGSWIWLEQERSQVESYLFFRKEFALDETPMSAELWISARTFFHVYVNGRHVGFGPGMSSTADSNVLYQDLGFLFETGRNVVAALVHDTNVTRLAGKRQRSGFWCQLDVDAEPMVFTDDTWLVHRGNCYAKGRPRRSSSEGFTERLDFRRYPAGWFDRIFDAKGWVHPNSVVPIDEAHGRLVSAELPAATFAAVEFTAVTGRGTCEPVHEFTSVSFADLLTKGGAGVYAAEAYLQCEDSSSCDFALFSDSPYLLFLNGECIKRQAVTHPPAGVDLANSAAPAFGQCVLEDPSDTMPWQKGWNHLLVVQQLGAGSSGPALVFFGTPPGSLHWRNKPDSFLPERMAILKLRSFLREEMACLLSILLKVKPQRPMSAVLLQTRKKLQKSLPLM